MSFHSFVVLVTDTSSTCEFTSPDHYAIPKTFEFPEGFDPHVDELPEAPEYAVQLDIDYEIAQRQLALMICHDFSEAGDYREADHSLDIGRSHSYIVATDDEADELWDADLDSYIDDCVLDQLPEQYRKYFNREKFKEDAKVDGRAQSLGRYDGNEDSVDLVDWTANGEKTSITYFIYRT